MSKRYVLLCDYGLDDAAATAYLFSRRGEARVDILPVGGNSPLSVAQRNAHTLLAALGNPEGVRLVDTSCVAQPYVKLPLVHGEDGMGDLFAPALSTAPVLPFAEWLNEDDGPYTLVSLGPCTVTRRVINGKTGAEKLLIMGGNIAETPNYEGREFNHALDIEAFNYCATLSIATVATLDSCRSPRFNLAGRAPEGEDVLSRILRRAERLATARHGDNCYVYDYIAVRSLFEPELFAVRRAVDPDGNAMNVLFPR